jgi:hypothetical protein
LQAGEGARRPSPCGEGGCTQFHHPDLYVQRAGWTGVHGAVFTITKEDSRKYNLLAFDDNSQEPVEEEIKQGTCKLRACGPSTFSNVDSFINHSEPVPYCEPLCAAVNINAVNMIDQNEIENKEIVEIIECKENVLENAIEKKSIEIDLSKEKIESSTKIYSVAVEIDPVVIAEPINVAELVNIGDSFEKIDSLDQYTINLCQTVSCNSTTLNIGYDSGATVTIVSKKVAEMNIGKENIDYTLDTIGGRGSL